MFRKFSVVILLLMLPLQALSETSETSIDPQCAPNFKAINELKFFNPIVAAGALELKAVAPRTAYVWMMSKLVSVERVVGGIFGGVRVVLKSRIPWSQGSSESLVGLRLPIAKMGVQEARFVGIQQISIDEIVVPTSDEWNRTIDYLNQGLNPNDPRFIKTKTYDTLNIGKDLSQYVRRFAEKLEVPVSREGISRSVLDNLSANNEIITALQNKILVWYDFTKQLTGTGQNEEFVKLNNKLNEYYFLQIVQLGRGVLLPTLQLPSKDLVASATKETQISPRFSLLFQAFLVKETSLHPERLKKIPTDIGQTDLFALRLSRLQEFMNTSSDLN